MLSTATTRLIRCWKNPKPNSNSTEPSIAEDGDKLAKKNLNANFFCLFSATLLKHLFNKS